MMITEEAYLALALREPEAKWELICGEPRRKPAMTSEHEDFTAYLGADVIAQLDRDAFRVRIAGSRIRRSADRYFVPDVMVVPIDLVLPQQGTLRAERFSDPLPLVVEVWSPSTGNYDWNTKLEAYRQRGDREIWFIHPFNRTLIAWRLQPDGSYTETLYGGGLVRPAFLPNVAIDLDRLFA